MSLIDIMAQAQILQERWIKRLTEATETQAEYTSSIYSSRAVREAPRLSDGQAIEQASLMADRFNRLYLRTLRQLRDLRRYSPTVSIRNAGQVSIGGQQLNVAQGDQSVPE